MADEQSPFIKKVYRGSRHDDLPESPGFGGYHFGTEKAAQDRLDYTSASAPQSLMGKERIDPFEITLNNPYGTEQNPISETELFNILNVPRKWEEFRGKGFDGIIYNNIAEDPGSLSYLVFNKENIKPLGEPRSTDLTQIFRTGDPRKGEEQSIGQVPNQIDKLTGRFRTSLTPNQFRQLASPADFQPNTLLEESLRNQDAVAPPWLKLHWEPEKSAWKVIGHEGRNRADAAHNVFGDRAIPVDFFLRADHSGATGARIELDELTPEMKQALENRRFISQEGVQVSEFPELTEEPRSTDLVDQRLGLPRLTGIGQVFRGLGSMIGGKKMQAVRKLITMAQQGYELLPEDR